MHDWRLPYAILDKFQWGRNLHHSKRCWWYWAVSSNIRCGQYEYKSMLWFCGKPCEVWPFLGSHWSSIDDRDNRSFVAINQKWQSSTSFVLLCLPVPFLRHSWSSLVHAWFAIYLYGTTFDHTKIRYLLNSLNWQWFPYWRTLGITCSNQ